MNKKFKVVFLGCPKNLVDTEHLIGELLEKGFEYSKKGRYVFIQTCAFIKSAIDESYDVISRYVDKKKKGEIDFIGIGGCISLRLGKKIKKDFPEIDLVFHNVDKSSILPDSPRFFLTKGYIYVKISEGCDEKCSFCTIPDIRGKLRSREMEDILQEIRFLLKLGFKEIVLISQSTGQYGKDLYGRPYFKRLLRRIDSIKGDYWIRIMYMHPADIDDELLDIIESSDKIINYMDIPIQHFSAKILKNMRRRGGRKKVLEVIEKIRERFGDNFYIRSELIVGFPGEDEKDFKELIEKLKEYKINRMAIFKYSKEKGTESFNLKEPGAKIIEERFKEVGKLAGRIMRESQKNLIGKKLKVLICEENANFYKGRSEFDAPEVDFEVVIKKNRRLDIPNFYPLKIKNIKRNLDIEGELW